MKVIEVNHSAPILIGDYPYADIVQKEVLRLFDAGVNTIPKDRSNVKSYFHTDWDWEPNNITFRNLKAYIREEIEREFKPGLMIDAQRNILVYDNFWAMVYKKGDYAQKHDHRPFEYSFAYFVKSKWYHPPLIFSDSGKKIRPKEGRFVAFPGYLTHHVPKHRYNNDRITISGNMRLTRVDGAGPYIR